MSMPMQRPGDSVQNVETPFPFVRSVEILLDAPIEWDLAATVHNTKAPRFISPMENSLEQNWKEIVGDKLCWLNPPFGKIAPWVVKCCEQKVRVVVLLPASVGTNWFADFVHKHADVYFIRPRLVFVGQIDPYPKDLMICVYGSIQRIYQTWNWSNGLIK